MNQEKKEDKLVFILSSLVQRTKVKTITTNMMTCGLNGLQEIYYETLLDDQNKFMEVLTEENTTLKRTLLQSHKRKKKFKKMAKIAFKKVSESKKNICETTEKNNNLTRIIENQKNDIENQKKEKENQKKEFELQKKEIENQKKENKNQKKEIENKKEENQNQKKEIESQKKEIVKAYDWVTKQQNIIRGFVRNP